MNASERMKQAGESAQAMLDNLGRVKGPAYASMVNAVVMLEGLQDALFAMTGAAGANAEVALDMAKIACYVIDGVCGVLGDITIDAGIAKTEQDVEEMHRNILAYKKLTILVG